MFYMLFACFCCKNVTFIFFLKTLDQNDHYSSPFGTFFKKLHTALRWAKIRRFDVTRRIFAHSLVVFAYRNEIVNQVEQTFQTQWQKNGLLTSLTKTLVPDRPHVHTSRSLNWLSFPFWKKNGDLMWSSIWNKKKLGTHCLNLSQFFFSWDACIPEKKNIMIRLPLFLVNT